MISPQLKDYNRLYRQRFKQLPELVLLGLGTGFFTALLIIIFKSLIELPIWLFSIEAAIHSLADLPNWLRFSIPLLGATLLWLYWRRQPADSRRVGITHIHERLSHHHGDLPVKNLINQLVGAVLAIGSGHPVGREGPAVHLGAALSSWLGARLGLPFSSQRLLVGCGSAAAITALFNLPLAGILFAMEVILLSYNLIGFTAVIISAVSANIVTQFVLGQPETITLLSEPLVLHTELPLLLLLAILIAAGAWLFQKVQLIGAQQSGSALSLRLIGSGLVVGLIAIVFPQILLPVHIVAIETLSSSFDLEQMLGFVCIYLLVTPFILGLGIPGGVIGPALALGAILGALVSMLFIDLGYSADAALYALIGMAAMMSAVIHAPLAALVAVFELSSDTQALAAAMIVIVGSDLLMRALLGKPSIFEQLLANQGLSFDTRVFRRVMMSTNVRSAMQRQISIVPPAADPSDIDSLAQSAVWLVSHQTQGFGLLRGDLESEQVDESVAPRWRSSPTSENSHWLSVHSISARSSLLQALDLLDDSESPVLVVQQDGKPIGVLCVTEIQHYYRELAE